MLKTVTIQIGNSDDKLKQVEWHKFTMAVDDIIAEHEERRHFTGGAECNMPWQNYCWVALVDNDSLVELLARLAATGTKYDQDSVAVTIGETQFI